MIFSVIKRYKYVCFLFLFIFLTGCAKQEKQEVYTPSAPEWSKNVTIYEVNVRQYTEEGTFKAFEEKLPELKDLGVGILWLMPIHPIGELNRKGSLGSYYAVSYRDKDDKDGMLWERMRLPAAMGWFKDFAISARFDINEYWIAKVEGHLFNGLYGATDQFDPEPEETWYLLAAKATFSF